MLGILEEPRARLAYRALILRDGPIAYWRLGESSGTNAADSSGNGKDGTYRGTVTLAQTGALSGGGDTAVLLDGSTGYVDATVSTLPVGTNARTIEGWVKHSSGVRTAFFGYGDEGAGQVFVLEELPGLSAVGYAADVNSGIGINDGAWHHIAATFDGTTVRVFSDGQQRATGTPSLSTVSAATLFYIGRQPWVDGANYWWLNGSVDEVAVYAKTLSHAQLLRHYRAGHNGAG